MSQDSRETCGLTPRERRLLELLTATGHLDQAQADACLEAWQAEADPGQRFGAFLRAREDLVPPEVIEELLGTELDRRRSGISGIGAAGSGRGRALSDVGERVIEEAAGSGLGVALPKLTRASERDEAASGPVAIDAAPLPGAGTPMESDSSWRKGDPGLPMMLNEEDSAGQVAREASRRASKRRSAVLKRRAEEPAGPSDTHELVLHTQRNSSDTDEIVLAGEEGSEASTKSFDPRALAAASMRNSGDDPAHAQWLPLAIGGAAALLFLIALLVFVDGDGVESPPTATPTGPGSGAPTPVEHVDEDLAAWFAEHEAPLPEAEDPLPELEEQANLLIAREEYERALALYTALPPAVRADRELDVSLAEERLGRLIEFKAHADAVLEEVDRLREGDELEAAARRLEEFLADNSALRRSATGKRIVGRLFVVLGEQEARPVETAPPPEREEPPERIEAFERRIAQGHQVVATLVERVQRDRERRAAIEGAEGRRARAASKRAPLNRELFAGFELHDAIVIDLDDEGFTLENEGNELSYGWDAIDPDLALEIRELGARDEVGEDQLRLGLWCLRRRLFEEARLAFQRAVQLEPRLVGQVPDVVAITRASRIFSGELEHSANEISLHYDFDQPEEGRDWSDEEGARGRLVRSRLEVRGGNGLFLTALDEIGFEDRVEVEVEPGPMSRGSALLFGVAFGAGTSAGRDYLVGLGRGGVVTVVERRRGRLRLVARADELASTSKPLALEIEGERLRIRQGGDTLLRAEVRPVWERCRALVGGGAEGDSGAASVAELIVRGRVRHDWWRKARAEVDALLQGVLARMDELPVFARPPGRKAEVALSAEDAFGLEEISAEAKAEYERGIELSRGDSVELLEATSAFGKALELAPGFAAAHFRRALVLERLGRPRLAAAELEEAIARCPRFFEAMAAQARLLAQLGDLEAAEAAAEESLALSPDHAPAFAARAQVRFQRGDLEGALEELDLALALDPWNDDTRTFRRNVSHVLRGPPWRRTFTVETEHYVVQTDISQDRCREDATELEAMRRFYAERFAAEDAGEETLVSPQLAKVLIFDTREGFHTYAELTTDDRVESLLGAYLPRYRQLLLYEDKADASLKETRRVLFHEAFHQFIDELVPEMPYWLNEGLAEYFSVCRVEDRVVTGEGGRLVGRLRDLRRFVQSGEGPIPFPRLIQEAPAEFYSGPVAAKYAQAWAMVHYFNRGADEALRQRYQRYLSRLREGSSPVRAYQAAFKGVEWEAVQAEWLKYVAKL